MDKTFGMAIKPLFAELDKMLLDLLAGLKPDDWNRPTIARLWRVKDVAAHLLDGNLRVLSLQRDRYFGEAPPADPSFGGLVTWLNQLNADWVQAAKRLSPEVLILLHQMTGPLVTDYYLSLPLDEPAIFPVAWAGETESVNWLHLAREYTEKWLHQQQIRDALGNRDLLTPALFGPFIQTLMLGLPHAFRYTPAPSGTSVQISIGPDLGGDWFVQRQEKSWVLVAAPMREPIARVQLDADTAWKLFSKSWRPAQVSDKITLTGDQDLGAVALNLVSVMA